MTMRPVRSALFANTSFKCVGRVSAKDARTLPDELHTFPDFIGSMKRRGDRTEFAAWIRHWTPGAIRLSVPLGFLERQPTITEEQLDDLAAMNRLRCCGAIADAYRTAGPVNASVDEERVKSPRAEVDEAAAGDAPPAEPEVEPPRCGTTPPAHPEAPPTPPNANLARAAKSTATFRTL